jgi:exosortase
MMIENTFLSDRAWLTRNRAYLIGLVACSIAFVIWSMPTLAALHVRWISSGFQHGYPIAVLSLFLIVLAIARGEINFRSPSIYGLIALVTCLVLTIISLAATVAIVPQLIIPAAFLSLVWVSIGGFAARRLIVPVMFVYFAIPFWQLFESLSIVDVSLNEFLRQLTIMVVTAIIRLTSIPALIEGDLVQIPDGTFHIADGCSGRGFFITGLELSIFYGLVYLRTWRHRIAVVMVVAVASLIGNWLRVLMIILIGHFSEMQSSLVEDHSTFGWIVFLIALAPALMFGRRLEDVEQRSGVPVVRQLRESRLKSAWVPAVAALLLISAAMLDRRTMQLYESDSVATEIDLPRFAEWQPVDVWAGDTRPCFVGAAADVAVIYQRNKVKLGVYLANFPVQKQGQEAIYYANNPAGCEVAHAQSHAVNISVAPGRDVFFNESKITESNQDRLVWHGLMVAGKNGSGALAAKFAQAVGAIKGRVDAQVLVFSIECADDCSIAREELAQFAGTAAEGLYNAAASSTVTIKE